jgi:hypothetical protein
MLHTVQIESTRSFASKSRSRLGLVEQSGRPVVSSGASQLQERKPANVDRVDHRSPDDVHKEVRFLQIQIITKKTLREGAA